MESRRPLFADLEVGWFVRRAVVLLPLLILQCAAAYDRFGRSAGAVLMGILAWVCLLFVYYLLYYLWHT